MGEVYRATDTNLKRQVAIKVLPASVAGDAERLARFQREAEVLASLNHPNIAAIYGLEKAGRTHRAGDGAGGRADARGSHRARRHSARRGPPYRRQIAEALEAAHEQGIIHRDLKPANIKVRPDGTVKVLDFGLAAVAQGAGEPIAADVTNSPTLTLAATQAGVILGTAAYMSPEQAAGKPVDKRADIWSFGVVLWEMLTGTRLFDGESVSHTLADVLRAEIDFDRLPGETPQPIRRLRAALSRSRREDPAARHRRGACCPPALPGGSARSRERRAPLPSLRRGRPMLTAVALGVAAMAMAAAAGLAWVHFREQPPVAAPVRFQIPAPTRRLFAARACCRRTAAASRSRPPGRTVARSCGCGRSTCSRRGRWQEPRG